MKLIQKLQKKYWDLKLKKRYKKFKHCSLPFPFWDKKRDTFEWVYYTPKACLLEDGDGYEVQPELFEALGNKAMTGLTYDYEAKIYGREKPGQVLKNRIMESHGHSFNDVVNAVYHHPESFRIPEKYKIEYSEQELRYLKRIQNYLLLIGLKDDIQSKERIELSKKWYSISDKKKKHLIDYCKLHCINKQERKLIEREKFLRYENKLAFKYEDYRNMFVDDENIINGMLDGSKNYRIYRMYSFSTSRIGDKFLLVDKDLNYRGALEFIDEKIIKFKNLTEDMVNYKLEGFKNFKEYKKDLFKKMKEKEKWHKEEKFNEDSLISYYTFKITEIFKKQ